MKVAFLQFEPSWGAPQQNLVKVTAALSDQSFDLIVLPELCSTGYLFASRDALALMPSPYPTVPRLKPLSLLPGRRRRFLLPGWRNGRAPDSIIPPWWSGRRALLGNTASAISLLLRHGCSTAARNSPCSISME